MVVDTHANPKASKGCASIVRVKLSTSAPQRKVLASVK
ncbi:hypothetical protein L917_13434 [Phytophthora nicotianae]|uniref:Uncharacterized protein n=1 Tax=Phytophthora nicotianae TaxID=4792 RepID=W2MW87_PHYNI|nr:hypothetical protein L915_13729 [Phytophthora nicotianae]ETL34079.1 hypothetical protein L916_13626 [Phytophthora nicotianae]ETL87356.1 hypothetical protein L917_13434 [Phytophthora nicotianae]ETM40580.1 hypothetical protein L914_13520 [Phytophthora nicotianae]